MSAFPASHKFKTSEIRSNDPTLKDIVLNGTRYVRKISPQRWEFTVTFPPMRRPAFAPIEAFLNSLRGQYGTFTIVPPDRRAPQGALGGTPLVNGAAQTGSSIDVKGGSINITDWAKAGDFVIFGGDTKVYQITADASTDGSGNITLSIYPPLLTSPADNASVTLTDVPFTVALTSDIQAFQAEPGVIYHFEFDVAEVR